LAGESWVIRRVQKLLEAVSGCRTRNVTVLVSGETGTEKELVASLFTREQARFGPLVRFNCAAIAPELADAELFGHTKGAFNRCTTARRGFFAEAHGGTLSSTKW